MEVPRYCVNNGSAAGVPGAETAGGPCCSKPMRAVRLVGLGVKLADEVDNSASLLSTLGIR